jgi:hypothetical protein
MPHDSADRAAGRKAARGWGGTTTSVYGRLTEIV